MKLEFIKKDQEKFLREEGSYVKNGETVQQRFEEIVDRVKDYEKVYGEGLAERIKYMIDKNILSLSTPVIANFGRKYTDDKKTRALPASCNIVTYGDSISKIYTSHGEVAMLSKLGAGVGSDFQRICQKNTKLDEGEAFYSNSKLDWLEDSIRTAKKVSQGATRRGYTTPFISIEDSDFEELMKRIDKTNPDKNDPLINNTIGIILPKGFRDKINSGDKEAQRRWLKVLKARQKTGKVYIGDVENMNKNSSPVYKKLGLDVMATNICVTGDQLVPTSKGLKYVKDLYEEGDNLTLFDGNNIVHSSPMLKRESNADVYEIELSNGLKHKVTGDHEVLSRYKNSRNKSVMVKAKDLTSDHQVAFQVKKGVFGDNHNPDIAFIFGIHQSDDVSTSVSEINGFSFPKDDIPKWLLESDEETQWSYIRGLLYYNGTVDTYNKSKSFTEINSLSIESIKKELLEKVQLLMLNLGVECEINNLIKNNYTLCVTNKNHLLKIEENTKFLTRKNVHIENIIYRDNSRKFSQVKSVNYVGKEDVYCPTVNSKEHLWVCNGVITSNCTEFLQPLFDDMTSVCVISALNLVYWDEIKKNPQMIKDAITFLDIVNEEYITLTKGVPFMEKARKAAKDKRDIGLGTLGFHELLQMKGYAFGDFYSRKINKEIYSTIRKYSEEATTELGEKLGSPRLCKEAGMVRRNASIMMIAPNKSTSFISNKTSLGIEPFMSNVFVKKLAKIQYVFKNKHLIKLLEDKGKNTREVWGSIEDNNGSVQHLDFLSEHEKNIFLTFAEISPKDIIDLAADRQEYIDMGQSLNLVFRKNYTLKDIHEIHKYAFEKGIKTLYYAYPSAHAALEKDGESWDSCVSCAD